MSEFYEKEMPERHKLFLAMEKAHEDFSQQLFAEWREGVEPAFAADFEAMLDRQQVVDVEFNEKDEHIQIGEADTTRFIASYSSRGMGGGIGPFALLHVALRYQQSPYVFDEDVHLDDGINVYNIVAAQEYPPFIVHGKYMELFPTVAEYLQYLREEGQKPRYLSDTECAAVMAVLPNQEPDGRQTAVDALGSPWRDYLGY